MTIDAGRGLNRAAVVVALSVLVDIAMEHRRGDFHNRAMMTPLLTSAVSLAVSVHGAADRRGRSHLGRDSTDVLAALAEAVGTGFHVYNVGTRVGGFGWQNLFHAAPIVAPMAMTLSRLVGFMAERVRNADDARPTVSGIDAGRAVFTIGESAIWVAAGRALHWIGGSFDSLDTSTPGRRSALHSFTLRSGLRAHPDGSDLHNGMAWGADGATFSLSHSYPGRILVYDYDAQSGVISGRHTFACLEGGGGIPDRAANQRVRHAERRAARTRAARRGAVPARCRHPRHRPPLLRRLKEFR